MAQASPFPQYANIDTASGGGDHSGHSTYHAAILKLKRRLSSGMTFQTSYVFSKILTDSDSYWPGSFAADFYNRGLEKSIGQYDVTHNFKMSIVYDLPFGKGKPWLNHGAGAFVLGGWRLSGIAGYSSGQPIGVSTSYSLPINNGRTPAYVTSYDGWRAPTQNGSFDPSVDSFFVPYGTGPFPLQGTDTALNGLGNETRYNPKVRLFPNLNENLSIAKSIPDPRKAPHRHPRGSLQRLQPRALRHRLDAAAIHHVRQAHQQQRPAEHPAPNAASRQAVLLV